MTGWGSLSFKAGTAAVLGLTCSAVALAQETGGLIATFDVSQSLTWDDNPDFTASGGESELRSETELGFGLSSETSISTLAFDVGATLEAGDRSAEDDGSFTDPFIRLRYNRETQNTALNTDLGFSEQDVAGTQLTDDFDDQDLVADTGTRQNTNLSFGFETGLAAPFGISADAFLRRRAFTDTTSTDLFDTETSGGSIDLRFDIDRTLTATLGASLNNFEVDGGDSPDRETRILSAGILYQATPTLLVDAEINYDEVELSTPRTRGRPDLITIEEGVGFRLGLAQEVTNGTWGVEMASEVRENGRRSSAILSRDLELRDGTLGLSFGLTQTDGLSTNPLYGIEYRRELPTGAFVVELTQEVTASSSSAETLNSRLRLDYNQTINSVSSWQTGISLAQTDILGVDNGDRLRVDFDASYRRDVGREWDFVGGYGYSRSETTGSEDIDRNEVFLRLEKSISWRP